MQRRALYFSCVYSVLPNCLSVILLCMALLPDYGEACSLRHRRGEDIPRLRPERSMALDMGEDANVPTEVPVTRKPRKRLISGQFKHAATK
uniref:Putative secreted protein n=1 Tax=Amblyomma parvum TaxID=251391 RepID=A0A023G2H2_AMBPA